MASRRELNDRWITACREIRALLIERGLETFFVEIADSQIFRPLKTSPIESTQAIVLGCTAVLGSTMDAVDFDHVNMVGCYRRGAGWYAVEDPPTVVVLVAIGLKYGYIPIGKSVSSVRPTNLFPYTNQKYLEKP
ncbi:hypothetical protein SI65_06722 [Aspergillus cristatus]|uniref:Uncharacterized protein n=1 Tax=Aspergillus cristatus TaxID=573508 RepID=A0A1E3BAI7_ASPCR|nr:hypothetical protein SI65_06722 [Aspergillus cristatus]